MVECPFCDREDDFRTIGNHWRQSCRYPTLSDEEVEMVEGLMMGDAGVKNPIQGNASLDVISANLRFLRWLDVRFGIISTGVHLKASAEDVARRGETSDVFSFTGAKPARPIYRLTTRNLPDLNQFRGWYSTGQKRFPADLVLTPTNAKFWYVGDGGLSWNRRSNSCRAQICTTNEIDRPEFLLSLFRANGFSPLVLSDRLMFNREETTSFLRWIGEPVPGYEYKWMDEDHSAYDREFERSRSNAG